MYRNDIIKASMALNNLSDQRLANQTGLSRVTITLIRNGKHDVKLSSLAKIAAALNINFQDLFSSDPVIHLSSTPS